MPRVRTRFGPTARHVTPALPHFGGSGAGASLPVRGGGSSGRPITRAFAPIGGDQTASVTRAGIGGASGISAPGVSPLSFSPSRTRDLVESSQTSSPISTALLVKQGVPEGNVAMVRAVIQGGLEAKVNSEKLGQLIAGAEKGLSPDRLLREINLTPDERSTIKPILEDAEAHGRPAYALQVINRAFLAVESVSATTAKSLAHLGAASPLGPLGPLPFILSRAVADDQRPPWYHIAAAGKGFSEIPTAVADQYTYEEMILENTKPGSLMHKWARPLGLAASLVGDPTMYLTFGATAPSKMAARTMMALAQERAAVETSKRLAKKAINPRTGKPYLEHERYEAFIDTYLELGGPMSMGDALDAIRRLGLDEKALKRMGGGQELYLKGLLQASRPEAAALKEGQAVRGAVRRERQRIAAYLLPTNVQGGKGLRFAGMEIPGTHELGSAISRTYRTKAGKLSAEQGLYESAARMFLTGPQARHLADDMLRSSAVVELQRFKDAAHTASKASTAVMKSVLGTEVMKANVPREAAAAMRMAGKDYTMSVVPGTALDEAALGNVYDELRKFGPDALDVASMAVDYAHGDASRRLIAALRDQNNELLALGSFSEYSDRIFVHELGGRTPGAGLAWLQRLAGDWAEKGKRAEFTAGSAEAFRYYEKMGAKLGGTATHTTEDMTGAFYLEPEDLARIARGELLRPEHQASYNLIGEVGELLGPKERRGLLQRAPNEIVSPKDTPEIALAKTTFVREVNDRASSLISELVSSGARESRLRSLWNATKAAHEDPVVALGRFTFQTSARVHQNEFIEHLIQDPRFSFRLKGDTKRAEEADRLLDPPDGFDEVLWKNKRFAVIKPIAEAIEGFRNEAIINRELGRFLKSANFVQNWWKIYATSPNPSFHVMNFLGAVWNNMLAGVYNPSDYIDSLATLYRGRMEQAAQEGHARLFAPGALGRVARGEGLRPVVPESTALGRESAQIVEQAEARGGLGRSSFIWAETENQLGGREGFPRSTTEGLARVFETPPELEAKKFGTARFAVRRARQAGSVAAIPVVGPLALLGLAPDVARVGRWVGGTIEDFVRLTPFMKASRNPQIQRALEAYGPIRVPGLRHPTWTKAQQAAMYDLGANISRHFQFDYTDLTTFERYIAKTFFPFYTYYRKNFVLQAQEFARRPATLNATMAMMNYIDEQAGDLESYESLLPGYFNQLNAVRIPVPNGVRDQLGLPKNQPLYLNPKLPFVSLNLFPPLWEMMNSRGTPAPQVLMRIMAPFWGSVGPHAWFPGSKVLLEAAVGHQLGLARPIDFQRANSNDWRNSYVQAPGWVQYLPKVARNWMGVVKTRRGNLMMTATNKYVLEQMSTPFISNFGSAIPISGSTEEEQGKSKADLWSWLSGVRLIPVDFHRLGKNQAYAIKNRLEARQSELRERGLELSYDEEELLDAAKEHIEIAREVDEARNYELYGDDE